MKIIDENFLFDDNANHSISEFQKEKGFVFTFFPKALTAGCTLETKAYNDLYKEFLAYG